MIFPLGLLMLHCMCDPCVVFSYTCTHIDRLHCLWYIHLHRLFPFPDMRVALHQLLLLLVPVFCEATVHYVRPTDSPTTTSPSCPTGHLCLTLNDYFTNNYFQSNTIFKFLPGTHNLERPLFLKNLNNVSLEAAVPHSDIHPLIQSELVCNSSLLKFREIYSDASQCSTIFVSNSINISLKGINVHSNVKWDFDILLALVTSEISFENVSNVLVQDVKATRGLFATRSVTITVTDCTFGHINNFKPLCENSLYPTRDTLYGVFMHYVETSVISDVTVLNQIIHGVYLLQTKHIDIKYVVSLYQQYGFGFYFNSTINTRVRNVAIQKCNTRLALNTIIIENAVHTAVYRLRTDSGKVFLAKSTGVTFVELRMSNLMETFGVHIEVCRDVIFKNSHFSQFKDPKTLSTDVEGLPTVISIFFSLGINFSDCTFTQNNVTSILAKSSNFALSGKVLFQKNRAPSGTAIIIAQKSNMTLAENCDAVFMDNYAVSTGGAIDIVTGEDIDTLNPWCFLHVLGERKHPRMTFKGNWAGKGGDVLYGGHLAIGENGVSTNCLQSFWNISEIAQTGLSLVASEPSRVCLCNSSGYPDCLILTQDEKHLTYPGQTINVSVVTVGQAFGSVAGSVFAQFIHLSPNHSVPQLHESQYTQAVGKDSCNILNYTLFQSHDDTLDAILALTPEFQEISYYLSNKSKGVQRVLFLYNTWSELKSHYTPFPKQILEFPVYVNVTLLPCPLGFQLRGSPGKCDCSDLLESLPHVQCDIQDQTITRGGLVWIGVEKDNNEALVTSEYCPLNYCKSERVHLGEYDSQCNYNHSGTLCGGCRAGLSLALGSSQCLSCSNWYLILTLPFAVAGVALVAFIKLLDLTIAHGTINGLIFYVNVVKANEFIFLSQKHTNPLTVFIAWANLDLGIETCFWSGLSAYSKTWLQFLFPLYIWTIAGGIIVLSKYSRRLAHVMGNNSVPVLATLFFLSYAKLLRTIIVGLSCTVLKSSDGHRIVWSADGNLEYLGPRHAPLFAVCVATLLFVWLPYTLLLFCGQWLYKCNSRTIVKLLGKITPFLDAHYGPLKGRHRYWFGAQLLIRAVILLISSCVPANNSSAVVFSISVSSVVLTGISSLGFYQNKIVSLFEMSIFANLTLLGLSTLFTDSTGGSTTTSAQIHIGAVFTQFSGLVLYRLSLKFKARRAMLDWLLIQRPLVQDDGWEAYELAAAEREREVSDDDTESFGSDDSLPTY